MFLYYSAQSFQSRKEQGAGIAVRPNNLRLQCIEKLLMGEL